MIPEPGRATTRFAVPSHPLLNGLKEIGRGEHCIVLDAGNGRSVFKVITCPLTYGFHTGPDRPTGPHYPVVYADHGLIGTCDTGKPIYLVELEMLYPLAEGSEAARVAAQISMTYYEACRKWACFNEEMGRLALATVMRTPLGLAPDVRDALNSLEVFVEDFQVLPDLLNKDNIMMRADGTLVFSDPLYLG